MRTAGLISEPNPRLGVSVLPRTRAAAPRRAAVVPTAACVLMLIAPALDLLTRVQPGLSIDGPALVAGGVASLWLLVSWLRFPNATWLAAASLAGFAGAVMRLLGADVAPLLS